MWRGADAEGGPGSRCFCSCTAARGVTPGRKREIGRVQTLPGDGRHPRRRGANPRSTAAKSARRVTASNAIGRRPPSPSGSSGSHWSERNGEGPGLSAGLPS